MTLPIRQKMCWDFQEMLGTFFVKGFFEWQKVLSKQNNKKKSFGRLKKLLVKHSNSVTEKYAR